MRIIHLTQQNVWRQNSKSALPWKQRYSTHVHLAEYGMQRAQVNTGEKKWVCLQMIIVNTDRQKHVSPLLSHLRQISLDLQTNSQLSQETSVR